LAAHWRKEKAMRLWRAITFAAIVIAGVGGNVRALELALPTDNDAIFHGGGSAFYQYIERDYHGEKSTPWEGGQYGFVRDPQQTRDGIVYTRFHEGIDIRPVHRDDNGEPRDEIRAIGDGKIVYTNAVPGYSNYGKYIVIEHRWDGSPYYSLYGHLSKIDIRTGEMVKRGQHIAVMGYTGVGINRERAHVHLELNLMLNHNFEEWYAAFHRRGDPNYHGIYNGINLTGLDIARLYLELHEKPALTIPRFLGEEAVYFKVALPNSRHFELPKLYPWMLSGTGSSESRSWIVSFTRSGLPLKIEPGDRKLKEPELVYVKPSLGSASYLVDGIAAGPSSHAHLTEHGKQMLELLIYPH
jgi:murein DD-endopeptidase MepM/ murein hydrolase activator NlpD